MRCRAGPATRTSCRFSATRACSPRASATPRSGSGPFSSASMILELTPEQAALRKSVGEVAKEVVAPRAKEIDESGQFPVDVVRAAGERGLCGATIPKVWGGAGLDYVSYALAIEAIATASATVA